MGWQYEYLMENVEDGIRDMLYDVDVKKPFFIEFGDTTYSRLHMGDEGIPVGKHIGFFSLYEGVGKKMKLAEGTVTYVVRRDIDGPEVYDGEYIAEVKTLVVKMVSEEQKSSVPPNVAKHRKQSAEYIKAFEDKYGRSSSGFFGPPPSVVELHTKELGLMFNKFDTIIELLSKNQCNCGGNSEKKSARCKK